MKLKNELWGETIVYDIRAILFYELQQEYQNKVKKDIENIIQIRQRQEGTYLRTIDLSLIPTIEAAVPLTQKILAKYNIHYSPNWNVFNLEWKQKIENIIEKSHQFNHISWYNQTRGDIHGQENLRRNYRKAMNEKEKNSWGIITNSMVDAIWYTFVNACEDAENQKKSWEYASKAQNEFFDRALIAHDAALAENFDAVTFPEIVKLFSDYYVAVLNLIKEGLGITNETNVLFNISVSNEYLNKQNVTKSDIINAIKYHPANGKVFIVALRNDLLDEKLMNFLASSDKTMIDDIYCNLKEVLSESFSRCNLHNFNFAEHNIREIIDKGIIFFTMSNNKNLWKKLIYDVYGDVINNVEKKIEYIKILYNSKEIRKKKIIDAGKNAKTKTFYSITDIDKRNFVEFGQEFGIEALKKYIPKDYLIEEELIDSVDLYLDDLKIKFEEEIMLIEQEQQERKQKIKLLQKEISEKEKIINELGFAMFGKKRKEKSELSAQIIRLKAEISKLKNNK